MTMPLTLPSVYAAYFEIFVPDFRVAYLMLNNKNRSVVAGAESSCRLIQLPMESVSAARLNLAIEE